MSAEVIAAFTDLYWNQRAPWTETFWRGQRVAKCPMDMWVYQEILFDTKPDLLIETGSCSGGSALFFASIFDMIGNGKVLTVDKDFYPARPDHPRIEYLTGSSTSSDIAAAIRARAEGLRTMVALDSLHTFDHVERELAHYGSLVSPGCYLVVEDTGVDASWGKPAASSALREFIARQAGFQVDRSRERQLLTLNPGGWVKRIQ